MELTDKELNKLFEELAGDKRYSFDDVAFEVTKKGEKYLDHPREFIPFEDVKKGMTLYGSKDGYKFGRVVRKITDIEDLLQYAENRDDQLQLYHTLTFTPEITQAAAKYDWVIYKSIWGGGVTVYSPKKFIKLPYGPVEANGHRYGGASFQGVGCYTK